MNAQDLAAKLHGCEYRDEVDRATDRAAKDAGLVIVFGASDDLMEFRGAINDEIGVYGSASVFVDAQGLQDDFDDLLDRRAGKDDFRAHFNREGSGKEIEAVWADGEYSWRYKTDIPHATFEVMEDGDKYCLGIVFALKDTTP